MSRDNPSGLKREELSWALTKPRLVAAACRSDSCLLCRGTGVDSSGLCGGCTILLTDEELRLVERWRAGIGP
ncbi:MAG: hypothetical protein KIT11_00350 [Fimbriimonadaceae bacterium]|nr:hypothetical protein [Fimbriimonadaceae bacterium]QYK55177.1 MAG: hypothetical protein KF733_09185 [Fimbriimonadaceae bacterium]